MTAYASINEAKNTVTLQLDGGSFYKLELHGKTYTTTATEITLNLINGTNLIKISTNLPCQGVIEKSIITGKKIVVYPNPFERLLQISTGIAASKKAQIQICNPMGVQVHSGEYRNEYGHILLDLSNLTSGMYILKLNIDNTTSVHRIVKL
ncbi:hypothetical protein D9M68_792760 [compost metagenome]